MRESSENQVNAVTLHLMGGLGNQLFSYYAGLWLAERLGVPLELEMSRIRQSSHPNSTILDFDLPHSISAGTNLTNLRLTLAGRLNTSQALGNILPAISTKILSAYVSPVIGYDHKMGNLRTGLDLRGYFQTYKYYEDLKKTFAFEAPKLRSTSAWFEDKSRRLIIEKPVVIHVRRGDYLSSDNRKIGALSPTYFRNALAQISSYWGLSRPSVWVFSDDINSVKQDFEFLTNHETEFIEPPKTSTAAESLTLMSLASSFVMSNSSFSYWAAAFAKAALVIGPRKWFKAMEDPEMLLFPAWKVIESEWL